MDIEKILKGTFIAGVVTGAIGLSSTVGLGAIEMARQHYSEKQTNEYTLRVPQEQGAPFYLVYPLIVAAGGAGLTLVSMAGLCVEDIIETW